MPTTLPDLILLDAVTGTGAGLVIGNAQGVRYSNGTGVNRNEYPVNSKVIMALSTTSGSGAATILVQTSDDNSSYTTVNTQTMAVPSAGGTSRKSFVFKTSKPYMRLNVSAISGTGAAITSYCTYGSLGQ